MIAIDIANTGSQPAQAEVRYVVDQPGRPGLELSETIFVPGDCPGKRYYLPNVDASNQDVCEASSESPTGLRWLQREPTAGPYTVRVEVTSIDGPDADTSNNHRSVSYPVKETLLDLAYVRVGCTSGPCAAPTGYGTMSDGEFFAALTTSNLVTQAMFPLGRDGLVAFPSLLANGHPKTIQGDPRKCNPNDRDDCPGFLSDAKRARDEALRGDPFAHAVVVLAPGDYLKYHDEIAAADGTNLTEFPVAGGRGLIVADVDPILYGTIRYPGAKIAVVAHELGHSYLGGHVDFEGAAGFWVDCPADRRPCEVGARGGFPHTGNLMETFSRLEPPAAWINGSQYDVILSALSPGPDPPVLLVSFTLYRDGRFELDTLAELPLGRADHNDEVGTHSISLLDSQGALIERLGVNVDFDRTSTDWHGSSNAAPVAFVLAYPPEAARIEFRHGGVMLGTFDTSATSLRKLIENIPDRGLEKNSGERRNALLSKVDAFEKMLEKGDHPGARNKLANDIRKHVESWVIDFEQELLSEATRAELLVQIGRIDARLALREQTKPPKK